MLHVVFWEWEYMGISAHTHTLRQQYINLEGDPAQQSVAEQCCCVLEKSKHVSSADSFVEFPFSHVIFPNTLRLSTAPVSYRTLTVAPHTALSVLC